MHARTHLVHFEVFKRVDRGLGVLPDVANDVKEARGAFGGKFKLVDGAGGGPVLEIDVAGGLVPEGLVDLVRGRGLACGLVRHVRRAKAVQACPFLAGAGGRGKR